MTLKRDELTTLLGELEIPFELFTHPAVFSTADVVLLPEKLPGVDTKNLFLRDEKRTKFMLVCVRAETRVHLKELGRSLGIKGITFASPEEMKELLGVSPGSVCIFSLANDREGKVKGYLDAAIESEAKMQNHPLENTATVVLSVRDMERFCKHVGHELERIDVPVRG